MPINHAIHKNLIPANQHEYTYWHNIKRDSDDEGKNFSNGFVQPIEIRTECKLEKAYTFINNKSNGNGVEIAEFNLPVTKLIMRYHLRYKWNGNTKQRHQYHTNTNIIDPVFRTK